MLYLGNVDIALRFTQESMMSQCLLQPETGTDDITICVVTGENITVLSFEMPILNVYYEKRELLYQQTIKQYL